MSVTAGTIAITSAAPSLNDLRVPIAIGFVLFITIANLRGVKEAGTLFAIPTYGFVAMVFLTLSVGLIDCLNGCPTAASANEPLPVEHALSLFIILRAFSSGATALTGVEAIADGVQAFRRPQARNAAATLVGQNLGARKPDRAEAAVWQAGLYNVIFLGMIGAFFVGFAEPLIGAFTQDAGVAVFGVDCLRTVSLGFLFYAYGMVMSQAFNGAGDVWTPTFMNLFCFWLLELPLAYVLAHSFGKGPSGVFAAITIAWSTFAVLGAVLFRRGRWKLKTV